MTLQAILTAAERDRESWKYTSLKPLRDLAFAPAALVSLPARDLPAPLDAAGPRLVFINGVFAPALSARGELPENFIAQEQSGAYRLQVAAQTCLAPSPLELLFIAAKAPTAQQSRVALNLTLGANARLTLVERHVSSGAGAAQLTLTDLQADLAPQAKLLHGKFQLLDERDYHLAQTNVTLAKGAYYDQFTFTSGAALSRNAINVTLAAPEAQTRLHGVYLLRGAQHGDTTTHITHAAPDTQSAEHYRGVLDGKARGVFQGKILVAPDAQRSDGQQLSRALLLSDQAEANNKPELEIYADDVKCSHGATIGQLDETALFYMRTRGIPPALARGMLIEAFIAELIETLGADAARDFAQAAASDWVRQRQGPA